MNSPNALITQLPEMLEVDSNENIIYEIANMLKNLQNPQKIEEAIEKLREALMLAYIDNVKYGDLLVIYIDAFNERDDNVKLRELLKKLVVILNNIMVILTIQNRKRLINYIINTIRKIALS
ncbi:MAG: hypothetical protein QXX23_07190 [Thermoplasmata archaeon]